MFPNSDPVMFMVAFYGCLLAELVPVPIEVPLTRKVARGASSVRGPRGLVLKPRIQCRCLHVLAPGASCWARTGGRASETPGQLHPDALSCVSLGERCKNTCWC